MSNLLSIFGFSEVSNSEQPEETAAETNEEQNEQNDAQVSNPEIEKVKEECPSENYSVSPESEPGVKQPKRAFARRSKPKKHKKSVEDLYKAPSSARRQSGESGDSKENKGDDGEVRRSKRGHKPKNAFSPGKLEDQTMSATKKSRKRSLFENDENNEEEGEERGTKRRRIFKKVEEPTTSTPIVSPEKEDSVEKEESEEKEKEKSDDEDEAGSDNDEQEIESSSSSLDDSEDDYMPSNARRKSKSRKSSPSISSKDENSRIPSTDQEVLEKIENGELPETVIYRPGNNCMFIPRIQADMINGSGPAVTILTDDDYFKFVRVSQKTKVDHAEPEEVCKILAAIRKRPVIWDQRLASHHNASIVRRAWAELDEELGLNDKYPLARRKQIWKNKRDYFGYAIHTQNEQKWIYSGHMEFYRPMVNFKSIYFTRPTISNVQEEVQNSVVLGNRKVVCTEKDTSNLLMFILKSIHDQASADPQTMDNFQNGIDNIFKKNLVEISEKYKKEEE